MNVTSLPASPVPPSMPPRRLHEIDGIRGWAALTVLLFHLFWEVFGVPLPGLRHPALRFVLDGHLAVFIFFVLSADALSWPFVSTGDTSLLDRTVLKRYFRLALPIAFSCLLAYGLMRSGLTFNAEAAALVKTDADWLARSLNFEPSLFSMLNFSFSRVFGGGTYSNYNAFLWPMPIELFGSFLVFAFCYGIARRPQALRIVWWTVAVVFLISEYYCLFFAGLAFSLLRRQGHFDRLRYSAVGRWAAPCGLLLCVAVNMLDYATNLNLNRHLPLQQRLNSVLAITIVYGVYCNASLVRFFGNSVSRWLGRISFPIYLLHFSVICSFTSYLIVRSNRTGVLDSSHALLIGAATVAVVFAAAVVFERLERATLRQVDRLVRRTLA
jgi:peptidoglycan/LPS O-acetylase OafA/YrhL